MLVLYPAEKRVQYELSLSEETATKKVTEISCLLQGYCTWTNR